jgi:hypothetical protein
MTAEMNAVSPFLMLPWPVAVLSHVNAHLVLTSQSRGQAKPTRHAAAAPGASSSRYSLPSPSDIHWGHGRYSCRYRHHRRYRRLRS